MKTCPFCAEEIQDDAIKCKHCGEFLDAQTLQALEASRLPWYFRTSTIVIAVCLVGPLALPLIWWRPRTSWITKVILSIIIIGLTWFLYRATMTAMQEMEHTLNQMFGY